MARKEDLNISDELMRFMKGHWPGDYIETMITFVSSLTDDPGADHTPGEIARMGAVLAELGKTMTDTAKAQAAFGGIMEDAGVEFKVRAPSTQERIDTDYMKANFPQVNYPEMWKTTAIKGSVAVDLPFKTGER